MPGLNLAALVDDLPGLNLDTVLRKLSITSIPRGHDEQQLELVLIILLEAIYRLVSDSLWFVTYPQQKSIFKMADDRMV